MNIPTKIFCTNNKIIERYMISLSNSSFWFKRLTRIFTNTERLVVVIHSIMQFIHRSAKRRSIKHFCVNCQFSLLHMFSISSFIGMNPCLFLLLEKDENFMNHENIIMNISALNKCSLKKGDNHRKNLFKSICQNLRYNLI